MKAACRPNYHQMTKPTDPNIKPTSVRRDDDPEPRPDARRRHLDALIIFRGWVFTNPACPALPTLLRRVERRGRPMSAPVHRRASPAALIDPRRC